MEIQARFRSMSFVFRSVGSTELTNSVFLRYDRDDSGDVFIALTRKGLSGSEVAIRNSLVN